MSLTGCRPSADDVGDGLRLAAPGSCSSSVVVTAGVFVFVLPAFHREYESKMIDFSEQRYYSPTSVRSAFASQRIHLRVASRFHALRVASDGNPRGNGFRLF